MTRHTRVYKAPPSTALRRGMDGLDILRKQRQIKDFDWPAWQAAKDRIKQDNYQEEIVKMGDLALVQRGENALETPGILTKDAMVKAVQVLYGDKPKEVVMATALACWSLGLDPNPGMGHVWVFPGKKGGHIVMIGIYGLIRLARRDKENPFLLLENKIREMNEQERLEHGLGPDDIGVFYPGVNMNQVDMVERLKKAGLQVTLDDITIWGIGIWRKGDNVWHTGTARLVAQKRALANLLKKFGLDSGVGGWLPQISEVAPKAHYDSEMGGYVIDDTQPIETEGEFDHQAADLRAAYEEQIQGEYHAD